MVFDWSRKVLEEVVHTTAGVDIWRLDEPTWWYLVGLFALQVVGREVFKRYGPFKDDAALFVHQVTWIHFFFCPFRTGSDRSSRGVFF